MRAVWLEPSEGQHGSEERTLERRQRQVHEGSWKPQCEAWVLQGRWEDIGGFQQASGMMQFTFLQTSWLVCAGCRTVVLSQG